MKHTVLFVVLCSLSRQPSRHSRASFKLGGPCTLDLRKAAGVAGAGGGGSSTIVQLARTDFVRQYTATHTLTWIYDNGKGVNFIPFARTEFDINLAAIYPAQHAQGGGRSRRLFDDREVSTVCGGQRERATIRRSSQLAFSVPTGSYKNGTAVSTITPTLAAAKALASSTYSPRWVRVLPTSSVPRSAEPSSGTHVAQYKVGKYFWPELEGKCQLLSRRHQ